MKHPQILHGIPAILGGSDTLRIFRSGTDAIVRECISLHIPEQRF
ncbi:hypothetical protein [Treponema sp. OMZ 855]|nr:hypothetical protein [Treponema sp. OMZ 855]